TAFCAFCPGRIFETPPEKSRLVVQDNSFERLDHVRPSDMADLGWLFRRVPNLYEIVTIDYWKKNYNYFLSPANQLWKEMYLSDDVGRKHIHNILSYKLTSSGMSAERVREIPKETLIAMSDAFFGGGHELVIAAPHFTDGAS